MEMKHGFEKSNDVFEGLKKDFPNIKFWAMSNEIKPVADPLKGRINLGNCRKCGKLPTKEGHDACLGTLPNVMNACCGHGRDQWAYVQFWGGRIIQGLGALHYQKKGA